MSKRTARAGKPAAKAVRKSADRRARKGKGSCTFDPASPSLGQGAGPVGTGGRRVGLRLVLAAHDSDRSEVLMKPKKG